MDMSIEVNIQPPQNSGRKIPTHARTYASTRSYLAPIVGLPGAVNQSAQSEMEELDGEQTRESYAELTSRWGLDMEVSGTST